MKLKLDKRYLCWGLVAFAVVAASIVFNMCIAHFDQLRANLSKLSGILQPITYGLVFAYLLIPVVNFLDRLLLPGFQRMLRASKRPNRPQQASRALSIFLGLTLGVALVTTLVALVVPQVLDSLLGLIDSIPAAIKQVTAWADALLKDYPEMEASVLSLLNESESYLQNWLRLDMMPRLRPLLSGVSVGVFGALNLIKDLFIGLVVSSYVLYNKETFAAQAKKLVYSLFHTEQANGMVQEMRHIHRVFGGFINGKLLDSLIIGVLCFVGMSILRMPYVALISVIVGVTNIIPFFGPFIGAIPSAIILLLVSPKLCLYFLLFILLLQQLDGNIIGPKILGGSTGLSSFWVLFAIITAGGLFGFAGMILGVPVFAVAYTLVSSAVNNALKRKELPALTRTYRALDHIDPDTHEPVPLSAPAAPPPAPRFKGFRKKK